jgi:hypothetical protein
MFLVIYLLATGADSTHSNEATDSTRLTHVSRRDNERMNDNNIIIIGDQTIVITAWQASLKRMDDFAYLPQRTQRCCSSIIVSFYCEQLHMTCLIAQFRLYSFS